MDDNSSNNPILYRIQCKKCLIFLSNPFEHNNNSNPKNEEIKVERFKGDNINYHGENNFLKNGKIMYSYIYCLRCQEKVGYWLSQASKKEKDNINYIFFFPAYINIVKYEKNDVTEEEDKKFQQEEIFYKTTSLTEEFIQYAKEHIENFIANVKKLEGERNEADLCYKSFDRRILTLKKFFIFSVKNQDNNKKRSYSLGINFSKEEISNAKKRNKTWKRKYDKENKEEEEDNYDNKSNGKNNLNRNNGNNDDDNINEDNSHDNNNGGNISRSGSSDIYIKSKIKKNVKNNEESNLNSKNNNNKEPSLNIKNNKKGNKNKRKRK